VVMIVQEAKGLFLLSAMLFTMPTRQISEFTAPHDKRWSISLFNERSGVI